MHGMHALGAHYQSVVWVTLGQMTLKPTDWGWKVQSDVMVPVQLEGEVAPCNFLKVIKCNCSLPANGGKVSKCDA